MTAERESEYPTFKKLDETNPIKEMGLEWNMPHTPNEEWAIFNYSLHMQERREDWTWHRKLN